MVPRFSPSKADSIIINLQGVGNDDHDDNDNTTDLETMNHDEDVEALYHDNDDDGHDDNDDDKNGRRITHQQQQQCSSRRRNEEDYGSTDCCDKKGDSATAEAPAEESTSSKRQSPSSSDSPSSSSSVGILRQFVDIVKYMYSMALLLFSIAVVTASMFTKQTSSTGELGLPPIAAFIIFWFLIVWLAVMEGAQVALVGLQPIDKTSYAESHPRTLVNTTLAHRGDTMERFIVGRQFLVVFVLFATNMMATPIENATVFNLSDILTSLFLDSGIALILITLMVGQLTAQVNAAKHQLAFVNNYYTTITIYVSLAMEFSGLMHSVYLVQILFGKLAGQPVATKEPPRSPLAQVFFWARVLLSVAVLGYAFAVTIAALVAGQTNMWEGVPVGASIALLFVLMAFAGIMEGMQIALFAVVNMPESALDKYPIAKKNCQLTFAGKNLQAFLIGRQIWVTFFMFVVARITAITVDLEDGSSGDENIFGVSDGLQRFFNTGLLGAIITTIVSSLVWRIIASSFPIAFLSNPLIYVIIHMCLLLEKSGLCSASWILAQILEGRSKSTTSTTGTAPVWNEVKEDGGNKEDVKKNLTEDTV